LLTISSDEWIQSKGPNGQTEEDMGPLKEKWKRCSLCGTPNKYIFYIENTISKKKLNVGSDCITEFGSIAGNAKKSKQSMQKNALRARNLQELLEKIPKVRSTIENWNDFIRNLPIILSLNETNSYQEIGLSAHECYEKILTKGLKDDYIQQLKDLIQSGKHEKKKILHKIDSFDGELFVLTNKQLQWIKAHQPDKVKDIIAEIEESNDSLINLHCATLIAETNFLENFAQKYNLLIEKHNKTIINLYHDWRRNSSPPASEIEFEKELPKIIAVNSGSFSFQFTSMPHVQYTISSRKFIAALGFLIFPSNKKTLDQMDVLQLIVDSNAPNKSQSYEAFFAQIEYVVNKSLPQNKYSLHKISLSGNYVDFRIFHSSNTSEDGLVTYRFTYRRYTLELFYTTTKGLLLKKNNILIQKFLDNNYTKDYSEIQYKKEEEEEIEMSRMNKQ
uniref:hypothetical protein n=1 Tax=Listeria valentina TaxID=2705293 RepID=UPI0014304521